MQLLLADSCLGSWAAGATILGALANVGLFVVARYGYLLAKRQLAIYNAIQKTSNSIRTTELVASIYGAFTEDEELFRFYDRIRKNEPIEWERVSEERLLNKSLTLFDKVNYLQAEGLLDDNSKVWEYVAYEIHCFSKNESVLKYIAKRFEDGKTEGCPEDIIPFTGFTELVKRMPQGYKASETLKQQYSKQQSNKAEK